VIVPKGYILIGIEKMAKLDLVGRCSAGRNGAHMTRMRAHKVARI
jgi:hypothetical protein